MTLAVRQQDGAPPRGSNLKDQVQQLPLQVVEITNRVYDAADLQQRVQVARHARSRRQLAQQAFRLQINYVSRMDDGGLCNGLGVFEFHAARSRRSIFVFQQKQETGIAGRDLVSVLQP